MAQRKPEEVYGAVGGVFLSTGTRAPSWYFGWIPIPRGIDGYLSHRSDRLFAEGGHAIRGSGKGQVVLLCNIVKDVWGRDLDVGPQSIGDCVGWGYAGAVDIVACIEIASGQGEVHSWEKRTASEAVYALSRVEYGPMDGSSNDGSRGSWASEAVKHGGTLPRDVVGEYDGARAKHWGTTGLPDNLEQLATQHRIGHTMLITSYEEARDCIANGYPVVVSSDQGFSFERDQDGFAAPIATPWYHCMKFVGVDDGARKGLLCMNSWGPDAHFGPQGKFEIPTGCFWVPADTCSVMLQQEDSFALSQFDGYPNRRQTIQTIQHLRLSNDHK